MVRRLRPTSRKGRFALLVGAMVATTMVLSQVSAFAVLPGSPSQFESNDGNMIVNGGAGFHDWANVSFDHVTDSTSNTDYSFTPGQKQDTVCPEVTGHGNPPKDDFTDVASFSETNSSTGDTYLYGATIRVAANGNASENVELKQGLSGSCPGSTLLARTPGDKLIAIDYLNGGTNVDFHVLTWVATGACFVGNDLPPCWGATVLELSSVGAEGLASQAAISAANNPISGQALKAGQFAEFGVNLFLAGIIPHGTCKSFPQTVWESRSSGSSFVSSTKDIAIENNTISNCGEVIIRKVTVPSPDPTDTTFGYTTTVVTLPPAPQSPFSLKDGESNDITNVPAGSYTATEDNPGPNFVLTSIDCSASDLSHGSTIDSTNTGTGVASFTLKADDVIDCTYTNTLQTGALRIIKNSTKTGTAVLTAGAEFCYSTSTGCSTTNVTDNGAGDEDSAVGSVCVSGLALGTYYLNETKAPPGYGDSSESDQPAVVASGTNCTDNLPTGTGVATFTDPPLADIQVNFRDGGSGETALDQPLSCNNTTGTSDTTTATGWDDTLTVSGVEAGSSVITITCTIKIDP